MRAGDATAQLCACDKLEKIFPQLEVVPVDSTPEALKPCWRDGLMFYDAYAVLHHLLRKQGIGSIVPVQVRAPSGSSFLHLVTREDQPVPPPFCAKDWPR